MDGFSYNNIFETKGIEYLAILAFFAILIPFWILLNRRTALRNQIRKTLGSLTASVLKVPQGLFYSENHTWVHLQRSGVAKIGLDDLLLHLTGEVQFKSLIPAGVIIKKGDLLAEIGNRGKTLKILAPVSGEILKHNQILTESPELINNDPYISGWMYEIRPTDWVSETRSYYIAGEAKTWIEKELEMFKDFLSISTGKLTPATSNAILQDGGELADHTLSELPEEIWKEFQEDFLNQTDPGTKHRLVE